MCKILYLSKNIYKYGMMPGASFLSQELTLINFEWFGWEWVVISDQVQSANSSHSIPDLSFSEC